MDSIGGAGRSRHREIGCRRGPLREMDKTFVKGLNLIEVLAASQEPRGITSLSREIGLTKSNVHRLLTTLAARGYVRRINANSNYELTSKIWELGVLVRSRMDLVKVS